MKKETKKMLNEVLPDSFPKDEFLNGTAPKHTQGEFKFDKFFNHITVKIDNRSAFQICKMNEHALPEINEANAQRIVEAVNMHDELVQTLKDARAFLSLNGVFTNNKELYDRIENTLKQAESK